ncbi:MAG: TetR/AcrR family transcriptional regulator [Butyricicoccaceae bacterium]
MPETKNNRRVRFTRSALRESPDRPDLEKPLVSITVKDICARADINRSTFYLHFKDVTDILRTTEDEIIEHMREHTPTHKRKFRDLQEIEGFFIDFLEQIRNNSRIMKVIQVLCSEQGDPYFVRKLQTMTYEAFLDGWDMHDAGNERAAKLLVFSYTISGMVSMLSTWATRAGTRRPTRSYRFDGTDGTDWTILQHPTKKCFPTE